MPVVIEPCTLNLVTGQPLTRPNTRKNWFGKHLPYGMATLALRPIRVLRGRTQLLGASHFCSISNVDSSLHIELENARSALCAHSSSIGSSRKSVDITEANEDKTGKLQDFIKEDVLVGIVKDTFPCTAEEFFTFLFSDDSKFIDEYRSARKDTNLNIGQWHVADGYDGQVREITFRSVCHSPMCPPHTAITEWQHAVLRADKTALVLETVQQAHDIPFGSYFEIHCRWMLVTTSDSSSPLEIKVGAHFKKWCIMQSKIKTDAVDEYKKEVELMLDVARSYISNSKGSKPTSTPSVLSVGPTDNNS